MTFFGNKKIFRSIQDLVQWEQGYPRKSILKGLRGFSFVEKGIIFTIKRVWISRPGHIYMLYIEIMLKKKKGTV